MMNLADRLKVWRRHLHQHPELSFQEFKTSEYLYQQLKELGVAARKLDPTGVIGVLDSGRPGPVVALRADIDALPLQDAKQVEYRSRVDGVMHACGHDGHAAILLGTAQALVKNSDRLKGKIILIFQPGEEKPPGGALGIINRGWLEGVEWVFGLHLWAGLPPGYVGVAPGAVMANADEFEIHVRGMGGHGSMPEASIDAVVIAAHVVTALQTVVSRSVKPLEPAVVSIGSVHAGSAFNIISQDAVISGTYRSFSEPVRCLIEKRIEEISNGVCAAFGATCSVDCRRGHPAVVNHPQGVEMMQRAAVKAVGEDKIVSPEPSLGGEDFAYYLQKVPGAFIFLGAAAQGYPHHHPNFDFAEEAMLSGVNVFLQVLHQTGNL